MTQITNTRNNTPEHCWECGQFGDCVQAQNMVKDTIVMCGFVDTEKYVDHFCGNCLPDDADGIPIDNEEIDYPTHCCNCGVPLAHDMTSDGVKYLKKKIADNDGCCREIWPEIWRNYL